MDNLRCVFNRLRTAELKLKPTKCYFGSHQVEYLGYLVSQDRISADLRNLKLRPSAIFHPLMMSRPFSHFLDLLHITTDSYLISL